MRFSSVCLLFAVIICVVVISEAYPFRPRNMDYLEALRQMQKIPQWHCMRYRRFHVHGPCSRWWMMRRT
ncbi:hypothetical protein NE865_03657 [Phthorimaea operculella]|nr:hypothetical protein NE865_03657 [Phthorimaea operculella]